jgi:hypothetical protein
MRFMVLWVNLDAEAVARGDRLNELEIKLAHWIGIGTKCTVS